MIKITCPKNACRTVFGVKDEHAGKKARCPKCGAVIDIPAGPGKNDEIEERVRPSRPSSASVQERPASGKSRRDERDRNDDYDDERASRRRSRDDDDRPRRKSRDYDDRDDDDYDDRLAKRKSMGRVGPPDIKSGVFMGVAAFFVLFAGINVFLPLFYVSWSFGSGSIMGQSLSGGAASDSLASFAFEGILIFVFALLLFLATVAAIVLLYVLDKKITDRIITIVCSVGAGLSLWYVGWMLGLFWIYFRALGQISDAKKIFPDLKMSIWPNVGTIFPLIVGLAAAAMFAAVLVPRRQLMWLGIAAGGGLALGLLFIAADVQPWADHPFLGQMKSGGVKTTTTFNSTFP
jgi:hypothetical protein